MKVANCYYGISHQNEVSTALGNIDSIWILAENFESQYNAGIFCLFSLFPASSQESKIHALSKNNALHFIANLMSKEEMVGEVWHFAL